MSCVQKEQTTMFQDAVSAASGRIEHDRCQRQMKGERDSVRNKRCEQQRSSTQISNGVKGNELCAKRVDNYISRLNFPFPKSKEMNLETANAVSKPHYKPFN